MRFSFMSSSCPELSLDQMIALARRLGYEGLEARVEWKHKHGVELAADAAERLAVRDKLAAAGLTLCCVSTGCRFSDPAAAAEQVELTRRYIDLAADVGAGRIRVFGGKLAAGLARPDAVALVAKSLRAVADQAAERGVTVCLETHDDWRKPADVAAAVRAANHPAVAVNWDIMHPIYLARETGDQAGATIDAAFETLKPWIRHCHVHDGAGPGGQMTPIGQGVVDHKRAMQLLHGIGYGGFLSGEWIKWEPAEVHLPRELATLKRMRQEVHAGH